MRRYGLAVVALCGLGAASFGGVASAQQFSADMVTSDSSQAPGKIYVSDGKVRMEEGSDRSGAVIIDGKAGTALILDTKHKIAIPNNQIGKTMGFMTEIIDPDNPCPQLQQMARSMQDKNKKSGDWACKRLGSDTVNGRSTVKFQATSPDGDQSFGWIDSRLKVLVKSQGANGGMELRNIAEGPQPASLFEIPADYQKMDMTQMMQQMMKQHQGQGGGGN